MKRDQDRNYTYSLNKYLEELKSLVDGAKVIVELWEAKTPAQKEWKLDWLEKVRKLEI